MPEEKQKEISKRTHPRLLELFIGPYFTSGFGKAAGIAGRFRRGDSLTREEFEIMCNCPRAKQLESKKILESEGFNLEEIRDLFVSVTTDPKRLSSKINLLKAHGIDVKANKSLLGRSQSSLVSNIEQLKRRVPKPRRRKMP